jgi:hypothetical protein
VLLCALIFVAAPQVQAADPAIDAITQAVARPDVLRGQFSQEKQVSGFRNPLRSQGRFVVARQHGVIWTTLKPFPPKWWSPPTASSAASAMAAPASNSMHGSSRRCVR